MQSVILSVASGLMLALTTFMARKIASEMGTFHNEFDAIKVSQRNQLKASIVRMYSDAHERGYITAIELDTLNRQAESYWALGGNSYVKALVHHANNDMEIHGTLPA